MLINFFLSHIHYFGGCTNYLYDTPSFLYETLFFSIDALLFYGLLDLFSMKPLVMFGIYVGEL